MLPLLGALGLILASSSFTLATVPPVSILSTCRLIQASLPTTVKVSYPGSLTSSDVKFGEHLPERLEFVLSSVSQELRRTRMLQHIGSRTPL